MGNKNEKMNDFVEKGKGFIKKSVVPMCIFGASIGAYLFGFEWGIKTAKEADDKVYEKFKAENNMFFVRAPKENEVAADFLEHLHNETEEFFEKTNNDNIPMDGVESAFRKN